MSVLTVQAWKCDACGHVWLADPKPRRCSKCKKLTWDRGMSGEPVRLEPFRPKPYERVPDVVSVVVAKSPLALGQHDSEACRIYRCGMCSATGVKDAVRGLK